MAHPRGYGPPSRDLREQLARVDSHWRAFEQASFLAHRAALEVVEERLRELRARAAELAARRAVADQERERLEAAFAALDPSEPHALEDCHAEGCACAAVLGQLAGEAQGASAELALAEAVLAHQAAVFAERFAGARDTIEPEYENRRLDLTPSELMSNAEAEATAAQSGLRASLGSLIHDFLRI